MTTTTGSSAMETFWEETALPALSRYIAIPNQSPAFDPAWETAGHMLRAAELARDWILSLKLPGCTAALHVVPGRTPLLLMEIEGTRPGSVLLYGHLDKQPPFTGWEDGLSPWEPVRRGDRLYGRGSADDGYAVFAIMAAAKALSDAGTPHARLVGIIECCEESGSYDLPAHVDDLANRIGSPELVICLDSGCGNYDQLWLTTSLRGFIVGTLTAQVLTEGVHSGDASGIVASSFRVLRLLLDRLDDPRTGRVVPEWLHVEVPPERLEEARETARVLGKDVHAKFPFVEGMRPVTDDPLELLLNRTWRPALSIVGQAGLPDLSQAGNVLRPLTSVKLSLRLPPSLDTGDVDVRLKELFERDPPLGARVTFVAEKAAPGWEAPPLEPWLRQAVDDASLAHFGKPAVNYGEGGSIPFMAMLGERHPQAQFVITGVLGPHSNAHGPNEFLHVPTAVRLSSCVADILAEHARRR